MKKTLLTAIAVSMLATGASMASTISGTFNVTAVNALNQSSAQSQAKLGDMTDAAATTGATSFSFTYTGALDFSTSDSSDSTTVLSWLTTGLTNGGFGTISGLTAAAGGLQLSKDDINAKPTATATTTFFLFERTEALGATALSVKHDDGVAVFDDATRIGGFNGPNGVRTTAVNGFDGGIFSILYVATNGDPSKLQVSAVPLPASAWMLLAGVGGMVAMRRRKKAA